MEGIELIIKYDNDLRCATIYELEHAIFNGLDMRNCILPENFFEHLFNGNLGDIKFPDLDFSLYDVSLVQSFERCTFGANTVFTSSFFEQMSNKSEPFKGCEFDIDFTRLDVRNVDFRGVTFNGNTVFSREFFQNYEMVLLYPLYECKFNNVDFSNVNLNGINIEGAEFKNCIFPTDFFHNLSELNIYDCSFTDVNFQSVNLAGVSFSRCKFYGEIVFPENYFRTTGVLSNCTLDNVTLNNFAINSTASDTITLPGNFGLNRDNFEMYYNIFGKRILRYCYEEIENQVDVRLIIINNLFPLTLEYLLELVQYIINNKIDDRSAIRECIIDFTNFSFLDEMKCILFEEANKTIDCNVKFKFVF